MSPSVQLAVKPSATPTVAEFHARLDALLPLVESRAAEAETQGYLTDDVVAALRKAGIYTMLFPKEVGGAELLPYDAVTVIERLAYAHASAGWCVIGNNMEGTSSPSTSRTKASRKSSRAGPTSRLPATACRAASPDRSMAVT